MSESLEKKSVTVGIPAYNEAANIARILSDVLRQHEEGFSLDSVLVYSDGSTDKTVEIVQEFIKKDARVHLLSSGERRGIAYASNTIFETTKTDMLVFLNADIAIRDELFLKKITQPIRSRAADITSVRIIPLPPRRRFERIIYVGFMLKLEAFMSHMNGNHVYTCHGPARAFSKEVYTRMRFKKNIADDMYSYLYAKQHNLRYQFIKDTEVYFRLPNTLKDHKKQSSRFFKSPSAFFEEFGEAMVRRETALPFRALCASALRKGMKHPFKVVQYLLLAIWMKFSKNQKEEAWGTAESSKVLMEASSREFSLRDRIFLWMRKIFYSILAYSRRLWGETSNPVLILCYHAVGNDAWRFSISKDMIERQMRYMLSRRKPVTLHEVARHIDGSSPITAPSFAVTFDDGYQDVFEVKEMMLKLGIHPTLFALSNPQDANRIELETDRPFLNNEELALLSKAGWEIACHSATHPNFFDLSSEAIYKEIMDAKKTLEAQGLTVSYFAYPKGRYTKAVLDAVHNAGYKLGFTVEDGFINPNTPALLVPRIGVDRTHSITEFKGMTTPLAIRMRQLIRNTFLRHG